MENKTFRDLELKTTPEGRFEARICTFDKVDKVGDIVRRGAFRESLAEWRGTDAKVPVIFSHQSHDPSMVIGDCDPADVEETDRGLVAKGRFYLDETNSHKVFQQIQRKTLNDWSFGYLVQTAKPIGQGCRELLKLHLIELGPTLIGCGDTETLSTKSDEGLSLDVARSRLVGTMLAPYRAQLDIARRRGLLLRVR